MTEQTIDVAETEAPVAVEEAPAETPTPEPQPVELGRVQRGGFWWGTGRRKSAVARVRIRDGGGLFVVNGREREVFFSNEQDRQQAIASLRVTQTEGKYDVFVLVEGGGPTGQSGAIRMGLARALCAADPTLEATLRGAGHFTRDSRVKERKKYGRRGARRSFQFSKR